MPTRHRYRLQPYNHGLTVAVYGPGENIDRDPDVLAVTEIRPNGGVTVHVRAYTPAPTITHEAVHAALYTLRHRGVDPNEGDGEAMAYLAGYVHGLILDAQRKSRPAAARR